MEFNHKIGFLGYGNMAKAISCGIISGNLLAGKQIVVFDANLQALDEAKAKGFVIAKSEADLFSLAKIVVIAIKPQSFAVLSKYNAENNTILSIMAGVKISAIADKLSAKSIARCMPNTPALVGLGMTAVDCSFVNCEEDKAFILQVLRSFGKTIETTEDNLNAVTAISGSGPAYAYLFIKALTEKAIKLGFSAQEAKTLVTQTIVGSCKMVEESKEEIDVLIERVCSKGGTTIQAVNYFNDNNFCGLVDCAVQKCYVRAVEMSEAR